MLLQPGLWLARNDADGLDGRVVSVEPEGLSVAVQPKRYGTMKLDKISGMITSVINSNSDLLLELKGLGTRRSVLCFDDAITFLGVTAIRGSTYFESWDENVSIWKPVGKVSCLNFANGVANFQAATYEPGDEWVTGFSLECSDLR